MEETMEADKGLVTCIHTEFFKALAGVDSKCKLNHKHV